MPVYAFSPQQPVKQGMTGIEKGANLTNAITNAAGLYSQYRDQENDEKYTSTLLDPNSSPLQQALAWTKLKNPQAAAQTIKSATDKLNQNSINQYKSNLEKELENIGKTSPVSNTQPVGNQATQPQSYLPQGVLNTIFGSAQQQPPQQNQQFAPPVQVDPLEEKRQRAAMYEKAALDLANKDKALAGKYSNLANQDRQDLRTAEKVSGEKYKADIKAQQKEIERQTKHLLPIQEKAMNKFKGAEDMLFALDNQLAAIKNNDVGIWSKANLSKILEDAGYETLAKAAETEGVALFKTNAKTIFSGAKEIFPGRVTNFDAKIFEQMMAQVGRDELTNEVTVETLKLPQEIAKEEAAYTMKLLGENPNISAIQLNSDVFNHMQQYRNEKYDNWHAKLEKWEISQKPKRQMFSGYGHSQQPSQPGQRKSLSELRNEYIPR